MRPGTDGEGGGLTVYVGVFQHWDNCHVVIVASSADIAKRGCEEFRPPDRPNGWPMPQAFEWESHDNLHWYADFGDGEFQGMEFRVSPWEVTHD